MPLEIFESRQGVGTLITSTRRRNRLLKLRADLRTVLERFFLRGQ
jgi:hypothetical protein